VILVIEDNMVVTNIFFKNICMLLVGLMDVVGFARGLIF
jgi:hypothetical protein